MNKFCPDIILHSCDRGVAFGKYRLTDFPASFGLEEHMHRKTVLLIGATGLVGGECLKRLIRDDHYRRIVVLTRSAVSENFGDARFEHHVINFDRIGEHKNLFKADHVLCALGSTIKKAGTKDQFYKVDFTYVYEIAEAASEQGAEHFLLVSSMGANPDSGIFYNRVKGELENAVQQLPFRSISIFRPSLILGNRKESRFHEEISKWAANIFSFAIPDKYQPIEAVDIAGAMLSMARANRPGVQIHESDEIKNIAQACPA